MGAVTYSDDERRLVAAAKNLATTMAEVCTVETYEQELMEAIDLNMEYAASIARRNLKQFIQTRSGILE